MACVLVVLHGYGSLFFWFGRSGFGSVRRRFLDLRWMILIILSLRNSLSNLPSIVRSSYRVNPGQLMLSIFLLELRLLLMVLTAGRVTLPSKLSIWIAGELLSCAWD